MGQKIRIKKNIKKFFSLYIPLLCFIFFIIFPIYWTLITAFKSEKEITNPKLTYWPKNFTFKNFDVAWNNVGFSVFFKNSMIIASVGVVFIVFASILVGYALSRFQFKGKTAFMVILLGTQFIPGAMLISPLFLIFKNLNLLDSRLALILINTTFQLPFNSILMKEFIGGIDYSLEEAAQIDGCSRLGAIRHAILPLLIPGIVATGAFGFISCWNEFLYTFMFISKQELFTLPVGLKYMMGEYSIHYGALAAGSIIALIPALILFIYMQKFLVGGLSAGGVKG